MPPPLAPTRLGYGDVLLVPHRALRQLPSTLSRPLAHVVREGDGDVVGVVTPLVRGVAQVLHGDQVVELSVLLEVQGVEGKKDREGQVEVEEEREVNSRRNAHVHG